VAPADSLARLRTTLLDRAERREAPVTQLCREAGISRSRLYELRARYRQYGDAGLRPKPRPAERPSRRLPEPLVDAIVAYAVEHPTHGERTIALVLATPRYGGWRVNTAGGQRPPPGRPLAAPGPAGRGREPGCVGGRTPDRAGPPPGQIDRAGQDRPHRLRGARRGALLRHLLRGASQGRRQGLAAQRGASSFGIARVIAGDKTAQVMARFLVIVLHLHYRVAFRYRYDTSAATIDADLQAFLRFYNFERPHRGYRTQGRTPASIFFGANHQVLHEMGACDDDRHAA
jgi:hypothetical protein